MSQKPRLLANISTVLLLFKNHSCPGLPITEAVWPDIYSPPVNIPSCLVPPFIDPTHKDLVTTNLCGLEANSIAYKGWNMSKYSTELLF